MLLCILSHLIQPPSGPSQPNRRPIHRAIYILEQLVVLVQFSPYLYTEVILTTYGLRENV